MNTPYSKISFLVGPLFLLSVGCGGSHKDAEHADESQHESAEAEEAAEDSEEAAEDAKDEAENAADDAHDEMDSTN